MAKRVLVIDDEPSICWGLEQLCRELGLECDTASSAETGLELADQQSYQVIVTDVRLPGMDGLEAIAAFNQRLPETPVIVMTAFGDLQTAITAIHRGAYDYMTKPFELADVQHKIEQAIATVELSAVSSDDSDWRSAAPSTLVGSSAVMQQVFKQIALTTTTNSPVLLTGESGTGKELAARAIHQFSRQQSGPFVAVNISSLNPSLIESELFGHVHGAFTDSRGDRVGLIQQAHGGTLFLDEIAEIPTEIQVKLLRVLDLNEVTPVGANESAATDFRLITATNQNLLEQINYGDFRHDLFYRIRAFEIHLPPLRQRQQDIPQLVEFFLGQLDTHSPPSASLDFIKELQKRAWPGNVRELRNAVERAAVMARGGVMTAHHLEPPILQETRSAQAADVAGELQRLAKIWVHQHWEDATHESLYEAFLELMDQPLMLTAYELSNRQYSAAARRLGIHRTTLKKKLEQK